MLQQGSLRAATLSLVVKRVPDLHIVLTPPKGTIHHLRLTNSQFKMQYDARQMMLIMATYYQPDNLFEKSRFSKLFATFQVEYRSVFMPKAKATTTPPARPEWKGFLERRLSETELEAFDNDKASDADIIAAATEVAVAGYDLKLSYSGKLTAFTCTLVDQDPSRKTAGYALSSQDTSAREALRMALYKHFVTLEGDWTPLLGGSPTIRRG